MKLFYLFILINQKIILEIKYFLIWSNVIFWKRQMTAQSVCESKMSQIAFTFKETNFFKDRLPNNIPPYFLLRNITHPKYTRCCSQIM